MDLILICCNQKLNICFKSDIFVKNNYVFDRRELLQYFKPYFFIFQKV